VDEHLGEGEGGAEIDPLAVEPRREGIEHAVAPAHEVHVVAEPAQQRLEGMAMGIDGAGQQRAPGEADEVVGEGGIAPGGREGDDTRDPAVRDLDGAAGLEARVHQDEVGSESHAAAILVRTRRGGR
jgi:hypothetical protein